MSRLAEERKVFDDRLVAEGHKVAAVEAERDALTSKVKELDARVRTADERAATLDAKKEELAAKLKAETRAKDVLADAEARASAELGEAKIALRQARDQQSNAIEQRLRRAREETGPRAVPQLVAHVAAQTGAVARQGARAHERVAGAGVRGRDGEVAPLRAARQEGRAGQGAPRCQVQGLGDGRRREADGVARRPPRVSLYASRSAAVRAVIPISPSPTRKLRLG